MQLQRAIELAVGRLAGTTDSTQPAFEHHDLVLPDCLFIKVREKLEKVPFDEILYVESEGRYAILYLAGGRKFVVRIPLGDLEEKFPAQRFARTHRSYIINLKWLQSVDLQDMTVQVKDKSVPLSKGFREQILGRLDQV